MGSTISKVNPLHRAEEAQSDEKNAAATIDSRALQSELELADAEETVILMAKRLIEARMQRIGGVWRMRQEPAGNEQIIGHGLEMGIGTHDPLSSRSGLAAGMLANGGASSRRRALWRSGAARGA